MTLFLPIHNPFSARSGIRPGVNQTHPASNRLVPKSGLSAIPVMGRSGNFVDLLTGTPGTPVSTGITSQIKTFGVSSNNSTSGAVILYNNGPALFTKLTLAVICSFVSVGGAFQGIISAGTDLQSTQFVIDQTTGNFTIFTTGGNLSGFTPTVGHTYFVVASSNNTIINFIVRDLNTGLLFQNTVSQNIAFQTTTGGYQLMNNAPTAGFNQPTNGSIYAAMANPNVYLSMQQAIAWSAHPWAFWYPDSISTINPEDFIKGNQTVFDFVTMNARETAGDVASFGISLYGTGGPVYRLIAGANVSIKTIPAIRGGAASIED